MGLALGRLKAAVKANPLMLEPDFRRLWIAATFNANGMAGEMVILGLLVYQITGTSEWVGISLAIYYMPLFIFGTLSGAVADWMDRRRLLRTLELGFIVAQIGFAGAIASGLDGLWVILTATALLGSMRAMHQPVRVSLAYDLIGGQQIVAGLGTLNLGMRSGQFVGSLVAGGITESVGAPTALLVLAAGHAIAWFWVGRVKSPGRASVAVAERAPIRRNLAEYLGELRRNRILLMLVLLTASVEVFGFSFQTALPELASVRFDMGGGGLGQLHAARAAGGVLASLTLTFSLGWLHRPGFVYLGVIVIFGVGMMLVSVADQFVLALAALCLVSSMATASDILTQSMLQLSVPNALRGRAMGAWSLAISISPAGQMEMGFLVGWLGLSAAFVFNGGMLVTIGLLVALLVPRLRRM
jgi:MFS family permease